MKRLRIAGIIIAVFGIVSATSAQEAPYQAYAGPALPRNQVAVIEKSHYRYHSLFGKTSVDDSHLTLFRVDGKYLKRNWDGSPRTDCKQRSKHAVAAGDCFIMPDSVQVLPGTHTIEVITRLGYFPGAMPTGMEIHGQDCTGVTCSVSKDISLEAGKTYALKLTVQRTTPIHSNRVGAIESTSYGVQFGIDVTLVGVL